MPVTAKVDNFGLIDEWGLLEFKDPGDIYVFHALKRVKDLKEKDELQPGDSTGDTHRLVRTWYVDSQEYLDRHVDFMRKLCDDNGARLYLIPQVRNRLVCRRVLLKKLVDLLDDPNVRDENIMRSAICGCHQSRRKRWIVDIDFDDMHLYDSSLTKSQAHDLVNKDSEYGLKILDGVSSKIAKIHEKNGVGTPEVLTYPTVHGFGIVCSPFDKLDLAGRLMPEDVGEERCDDSIDTFLLPNDNYLSYQILNDDIKTKGGMMLVYCNF